MQIIFPPKWLIFLKLISGILHESTKGGRGGQGLLSLGPLQNASPEKNHPPAHLHLVSFLRTSIFN
jgi:hypothetical protein